MDEIELLKRDLQKLNDVENEYLKELLDAAKDFIHEEGIVDDGTQSYKMIKVQYAAYLYRKRAAPDTVMPRFLRWEMNNKLFSQKSK